MMSSQGWLNFAYPCKDAQVMEVAYQILSPVSSTDAGNFVRNSHCHTLSPSVNQFSLLRAVGYGFAVIPTGYRTDTTYG
jgi:hypothetical protein